MESKTKREREMPGAEQKPEDGEIKEGEKEPQDS